MISNLPGPSTAEDDTYFDVPAPLLIVQPTGEAAADNLQPPLPSLFRDEEDDLEMVGPCKRLKVETL